MKTHNLKKLRSADSTVKEGSVLTQNQIPTLILMQESHLGQVTEKNLHLRVKT